MGEQQHMQTVQEIFSAFGRGDIAPTLDALADDVEWHEPGPTAVLPWAGTRHGRAQVAQFFTAIGESLEILQFEPREFWAEGDKVAVFGYEQARAKPTDRTYESEWVMVFTLRQGQVVGFHRYYDTAAAVVAFRSLTTYRV
jgi:ketosteroid isomerase-like protein